MSEILWGDQIPKQVLKPGYWGSHGFGDDCEWSQIVTDAKGFSASVVRYNQRQSAIWQASYSFAAEFWDNETSQALGEFREGTTFDAGRYDIGTVIRRQSEVMDASSSNGSSYFESTQIGIICEVSLEEEQRMIAYYYQTPKVGLNISQSQGPLIEVGTVDHLRIKSVYPRSIVDTLTRTTMVEVLRVGSSRPQGGNRGRRRLLPRLRFAPLNELS